VDKGSDPATVLAIIALVVSGLALLVAVWQAWINHRRFGRERSALLRAEYNGLLQMDVDEGGRRGPVGFEFRVRNTGAAPASRVTLWLEDESGEQVSSLGGGRDTLMHGEERTFKLRLTRRPSRLKPGDSFRLHVAWEDDLGPHARTPDVRVP
jgi:hypothetical protein